MRRKNTYRGAVALVTAIACVVLMTNPASATVHDAVFVSGNLTFTSSTSAFDLPLGGTPGTGCGSTVQVTANTPTAGSANLTTYTSTSRITVPTTTGTAPYVAVATRTSSTAGSYSDATKTATGLGLTLQVDVFAPTNPNPATDCAHGTVRSCRFIGLALSIDGRYGNGVLATPTPGLTALLSSTLATLTVTPPCNATLAAYTTGTATMTSCVALTLTT